MKKFKSAFSLIEISIVILVIGLIVAGITQASRLVAKSALTSAQAQTSSAPVAVIDGLVLWLESTSDKSFLEAEAKDGTALSTWNNINPTMVYGIGTGTQTSATHRPTYKAKGQNNLPVVVFSTATEGEEDYFDLPDGSVPYGDADYTAFIVAQATSACTCSVISSGAASSGNDSNTFGFDGSAAFINTWGTNNYTFGSSLTGKYHIYSVVYSSGSSRTRDARVDGTAADQDTPAGARASTAVHNRVGANNASSAAGFLDGEVAEIIMYSKALKSDEIDDVQKYLSKKWRIKLN